MHYPHGNRIDSRNQESFLLIPGLTNIGRSFIIKVIFAARVAVHTFIILFMPMKTWTALCMSNMVCFQLIGHLT